MPNPHHQEEYQIYIFSLFLYKNICCGYSLEAHCWGVSNEHPQNIFSWRNKKNFNTFCLNKDVSILFCLKKKCLSGAIITKLVIF